MPAQNDQMSVQELLARRWKAHREAVRVGDFSYPDGTFGFLAVDRVVQPPQFTAIAVGGNGKVRALRGDLASDEEAREPVAAIAGRVLSGQAASKQLGVGEALAFLGLVGDRSSLVDLSIQRFTESLADPRIAGRLPKANLAAAEVKRFNEQGLARVRAALNADALDVLGAVGDFQWRDYVYYAEPGEKGIVRRQAAQVYPLLATIMAGRPSIKGAIDRRESLADAIQNAFGSDKAGKQHMGKGVLKRIQGLTWPTGGIPPEQIAHALAEIPPDWFPKDREEWDAFCDVTATVGTILRQSTGQGVEILYAGCGGKWVEFRARCAKSYTDTRPPQGYEADPPEWLSGGALDAVNAAFDWKAAIKMTSPELAEAARNFVADFAFPEGVKRPDGFDGRLLAEYLVHNGTYVRVKASVDWKALDKLPRDKVEAASVEAASRITDLPQHMTPDGIAYWIQRLYAPDISREAMRTAATGVDDMLGSFSKKVILPLAALKSGLDDVYLAQISREEAHAAAAKVLCGGMAANNIFESSRWFHSQFEAILNAGADERTDDERQRREDAIRRAAAFNALGIDHANIPPDGWPPLCAIAQAPNGVYIVPLTDPALLNMEGLRGINPDGTEGLHHCVGGYSETCRRGGHILSLRQLTPDGRSFQRLSTAEIAPIVYGDRHLTVNQHYGKLNGKMPDSAARAFEWFSDAVGLGTIPLNYDGIKQHLGSLGIKADDMGVVCGYEWREEERINKAMRPWSKLVSKRYRKMGLDEFAAEPEIAAITNIFNPTYVPRGP